MPKSTTTCNNFLKLIFNATAWANMADNAAASPYSNLYLSLHTADPGVGNSQTTNETAYTNYVRIAIARTTASTQAKSGVSRLWLIDYYTKAFAPKELPKPKRKVSNRKAIQVEAQRQQAAQRKVQRAVAKAEADIQQLTKTIEDHQAAQQFVANLVAVAEQSTKTIVSFLSIGLHYQQLANSADDDLLLFALGMARHVDPVLGAEASELMLLSHVL